MFAFLSAESGIARKKQKSSIDSGCPEDGTSTPGEHSCY